MAKRETLEKFARNLHKFAPIIQKRIVRDWQNYTEESFAESQAKVPILTGDLLRSGAFRKARITNQGIESDIIYTMPYAQVIESGKREGKNITLRPEGYQYPTGATKARKGQTEYLSSAVKARQPDAIQDIMRSIDKAWDLI